MISVPPGFYPPYWSFPNPWNTIHYTICRSIKDALVCYAHTIHCIISYLVCSGPTGNIGYMWSVNSMLKPHMSGTKPWKVKLTLQHFIGLTNFFWVQNLADINSNEIPNQMQYLPCNQMQYGLSDLAPGP